MRYCNATALLLASLHHLLAGVGETTTVSSDFLEEVTKIKELLVTLNEQSTLWLGFMIGSCARMERDRWIAPLDFKGCPPGMKENLRHDDMSAKALFPTGYDRLKRRSNDIEVREKMVAGCCQHSAAHTFSRTPGKVKEKEFPFLQRLRRAPPFRRILC